MDTIKSRVEAEEATRTCDTNFQGVSQINNQEKEVERERWIA